MCSCQGKCNPQLSVNNTQGGILGRQEEVRATAPRLERGKFLVLTAETKIRQQGIEQEANRPQSRLCKTSPRLIHSVWYAGSSDSGLDFPVACVCEKSHLNVDDRVSAATPHLPVSSSVSLQPSHPPFFPPSFPASMLLKLQ